MMIGTKGTNVEAAAKQRIHMSSTSRISLETQPNLHNVNSLDSSKLSSPTESECHYKNGPITNPIYWVLIHESNLFAMDCNI